MKLNTFFCIILFLHIPQYLFSQNDIVKKGVINLYNYNFDDKGILNLKGEWAFYFEKEYKDIQSKTSAEYIKLPFSWTQFGYPRKTFAVYKLNIVMPKDYNDLILRLAHQSTAYNLYFNKELVYSVGQFGTDRGSSIPSYEIVNQIIPNNLDTLEIALEISNFDYRKGGIWSKIHIGKIKSIAADNRNQLSFDIFLIGALGVLLIYHLILFFQLKVNNIEQYKIPLLFSALTFMSVLRTSATGQLLLTIIFPNLSWYWLVKFEFISFFMLVGLALKYIKLVFPKEFSTLIVNIALITSSIISLITFFLPVYYSSFLIMPMQLFSIIALLYFLFGVILAVKRKRDTSGLVLFASVVLTITFINDILDSKNIISTLFLSPFGILLFFLSQAVSLSKLLTYSFQKGRILSSKLKKLNEELEQKVEERTAEIVEINKDLELLSIVADKTDNAVLIVSPEGQIEWINEGFTKLYGFTLEEFKANGSNILDAVTNTDIIEPIKNVMNNKQTYSYNAELISKEGKKIWVNTTWTPVLDENNNILKLVAIDADISKRKEVENSLKLTNAEITKQNKNITHSIIYAKRIQQALLSRLTVIDTLNKLKLKNILAIEYFSLFKPKEIVSGDFYWAKYSYENLYLAATDCTGHGVPGAFMTALGISFLDDITNLRKDLEPNIILNKLRTKLIKTLRQTKVDRSKDGMDISLCRINFKTMTLEYAGAYQPLYLVRNENGQSKLIKIKGDRMPIGVYAKALGGFTKTSIKIENNDSFYFGSDGYVSQIGGENNETFKSKRLEKLLLDINHLPMVEQNEYLDKTLSEWRQDNKQVDDILMFGIKLMQKK